MEPLGTFEIIMRVLYQFLPVWAALVILFTASIA
jgi:peptide/nickel transport system permease protein